ncbi:energy-coupling factor ABC transporter substrate-binding protein [Brooklawnia propionicigenes]|uniref:Cobalt transport protein CbiN n=1 Tax=Brooklawnia propionicigenes TaxID=3041175 RepID=A0AAN0K984_9ACTN|nr:energy-coupling factor ABC transporter substrate-binding protein [Brooklawnia sp. SH051]BEH01672.1 energy-coupling factor ABC transporter substrate-binding protein [Brooklawnia sp. SH051]
MSKKNPWITFGLIAAIIAIFVLSFALAPKPGDGEEGFTGTDSVVTETLEQEGTEPWFQPIFEPGSGEIESGLFALQAALGAGIVGFALGNLRGRAKSREEFAAAGPAPVKPSGDAPVPATE